MKSVKIEVVFNKPRALEFCEALKAGRPIGAINADELLTLAGACLCRHYENDQADALDEKEVERLVKNLLNAVEHSPNGRCGRATAHMTRSTSPNCTRRSTMA